ncbi:MAG TPA: beta-propeller fold lactonase family protein, partial [Blastocatellia bacterium]|nr:beta-propeller fold lactonase family protein [Blastocatellia bacterium]
TITNPDGPNRIAVYERNTVTGELVFLSTYLTGGRGNGRVVDSQSPLVANAEGTLLFAVNPGSDDVSVMSIAENGSLDPVGAPAPTRGVEPASLALANGLLYIANKGDLVEPPSYSGFRVSADGALERIKRRIVLNIGDNPTQVLFSRDGRRLIGIRFGSGGLDVFAVKPTGRLRGLATLDQQRGPFAGVFNPRAEDQLVIADARLPGAASYQLQDDDALSRLSLVSNAPERAACWIAMHSDGTRAWVSNTGTSSLSLFAMEADGRLSLSGSHSTAAYGRAPFELALDAESRFLYELNTGAGSQSIHVMQVGGNPVDGGLTDVGAVTVPIGSSPIGLAVVQK